MVEDKDVLEDKDMFEGGLITWLVAVVLVFWAQLNGSAEPHCLGNARCGDAIAHSSHVFGAVACYHWNNVTSIQ